MSASPRPGKLVSFLLRCVALDVEGALYCWRVFHVHRARLPPTVCYEINGLRRRS